MTQNGEPTALINHEAYERDGETFTLESVVFETRLEVDSGDGDDSESEDGRTRQYRLRVTVPSLSAAVEEVVEEPIAEGWFETFSLRLQDAPDVTRGDVSVPEPTVERVGTDVVIEVSFEHRRPSRAAETAKSLAEYVEGTYAQGVVPGFTYRAPVSTLLASARSHGEGEEKDGSDSGGDGSSPMPL